MSSFSNGDQYQSKGVGGGAGGFHTTKTTRGESLPNFIRLLGNRALKPFVHAFQKRSKASQARLRQVLGIEDGRIDEQRVELEDVGKSRKRGQGNRESTLEPGPITPIKRRIEAKSDAVSNEVVAVDGGANGDDEENDDEDEEKIESEEDVQGGSSDGESENARNETPPLSRSASFSSTDSSAGPATPETPTLPRKAWSVGIVPANTTSPSNNSQSRPHSNGCKPKEDQVETLDPRFDQIEFPDEEEASEGEAHFAFEAALPARKSFFELEQERKKKEQLDRKAKARAERQAATRMAMLHKQTTEQTWDLEHQKLNREAGFVMPSFRKKVNKTAESH